MKKSFVHGVTARYGMIIFAWILVVSFLLALAVRQTSADELYTRIVTAKITYMIVNDYDRTSPVSPFDLAKWEIETAAFEEEMPAVMQVVMRNPDPEGSPLYPRLIVRVMWHSEHGLVGLVMAYDYVIGDTRYAYVLDDEGYRFEPVKPVENPHPDPLPEGEGEIRKG